MDKKPPQTSSNNLFSIFELNSLLLYSVVAKSFSAFISTPFENFRSQAQAKPNNYKGMLYASKELGFKGSFKGSSINISLGIFNH